MQFSELGLPEPIVRAAAQAGYTDATSIQCEAIPILNDGHDLVACSQTGTGKTAAFAMPLLAKIDLDNKSPQLLVLTPTRELAIQVAQAFEQYGSELKKLRVLAVYGGAAYQPQLSALHRGVHVIVGTPGRLIDHIKQSAINLSAVHTLVLDEADEMLRMGFIDDVRWVLSQAPAERQIALFSATMPGPIRDIAQQHLRQPKSITVERSQRVAQTIRQQHLVVAPRHKLEVLCRLLEVEKTEGVIVFVKTKIGTIELADRLAARGLSVAPLNGDIPQAQRTRTVEKLKSGEIDILVATDVAARGLDVDRISHVINYDLPHDQEAYVHRIGRTGRAGRDGAAILLVSPAQRHVVRSIQRATGQSIELIEQPSVAVINQSRAGKLKEQIAAAMQSKQLETFTELIEQYCQETGESPLRVGAALAVMAHGDRRFFAKAIEEPSFGADRPARPERQGSADRDARPDRQSHAASNDFSRRGGPGSAAAERYRLEVGKVHGVMPGNLVGAIANEAGLDGSEIGRIDIFDHFSIVSLPAGMPPTVFDALSRTWVSGRQLRISKDTHPAAGRERSAGYPSGPKRFARSKNKGGVAPKAPRPFKKDKTFVKAGTKD